MDGIPSDWVGKPEAWLNFMTTNLTRNDLLTKTDLIDKFGAANYAVFALMLMVSAGIGVFFWWKGQKNTEEFLMASRSMGTIPMTLSLVASFMSAITLLGTPAEMYVSGTQYTALALSYPLVMGAAAHLFLPVFDNLQVWYIIPHIQAEIKQG